MQEFLNVDSMEASIQEYDGHSIRRGIVVIVNP
jgi:hypothetical protein